MFIRSVLTIAVLASFVFGAAANATSTARTAASDLNLTAQVDGLTSPGAVSGFATAGGLGSTRR